MTECIDVSMKLDVAREDRLDDVDVDALSLVLSPERRGHGDELA